MIATPRCVIVNVNNAAGELKFFSILINTLTRTKFEDIIAAKSTAGMVPMVYFQFIFINNFPNSLNYFYFLVSFLFLSVTKMYILFWWCTEFQALGWVGRCGWTRWQWQQRLSIRAIEKATDETMYCALHAPTAEHNAKIKYNSISSHN